ncbi:MAG: hypothetical protein A2W05_09525 [Candidatus Schekmanbacteria bacterium RBG_16_38_10]|uniref:Lipopolysaccharide heptosyltransferase II n=1 Tax=Candidatus Schekmanbacteria bacterium RBG_16_38_10 TaxID=1817879 RepID=A0A1F7RRH9_9BACT|nr:MAG: hypothetical protein A2W05_09525 [Candidatus Schekmanbacteria bacterium RBG_16_38_10]
MIYVLLSYLFYPFLSLITSLRRKTEIKRILVIQTAKIGDMICSTPVFREIKKKYPAVKLSVVANPITKELLSYNPYVDEIIELDTKDIRGITGKLKLIKLLYRGKYDISLSLNPSIPFTIVPLWALIAVRIALLPDFCGITLKIASGLNTHYVRHETGKLVSGTYMEMLKVMDVRTDNISKEVYKSPDADKKIEHILGDISPSPTPLPSREGKILSPLAGETFNHIPSPFVGGGKGEGELEREVNKPLLGIAVSSGNKLKELGSKKITELINTLLNNIDTRIVLIGSDADRTTADRILSSINRKDKVINTVGELSLTELPALIERLSLFMGVDTGITYMADALSVPLIDIAGPSDMSDQRPLGRNSTIIQRKDISCIPCSHTYRAPYSCGRGDRICITSVSVSEIMEAVRKLLNLSFPPRIKVRGKLQWESRKRD